MSTTAIQARPTLYKGIQMRSRLEADYAAHLDRWGVAWEYEPRCFAGPAGQWLPDFRQGDYYVEVKPADAWLGDAMNSGRINALLRRMEVAWLSEPAAFLDVVFWTYGGPRAASLAGRRGRWSVLVPGWPPLPWAWGRNPLAEAEPPVPGGAG